MALFFLNSKEYHFPSCMLFAARLGVACYGALHYCEVFLASTHLTIWNMFNILARFCLTPISVFSVLIWSHKIGELILCAQFKSEKSTAMVWDIEGMVFSVKELSSLWNRMLFILNCLYRKKFVPLFMAIVWMNQINPCLERFVWFFQLSGVWCQKWGANAQKCDNKETCACENVERLKNCVLVSSQL